jgi:hypothetical protein
VLADRPFRERFGDFGFLDEGAIHAEHHAPKPSAVTNARRPIPTRKCGEPELRGRSGQIKKLKHEAELYKAALQEGIAYAEKRGAVIFEPTDSASQKALYVYRLLVHDKKISPMPEEQVSEKSVRHRLAAWYAHQLPKDSPLLT